MIVYENKATAQAALNEFLIKLSELEDLYDVTVVLDDSDCYARSTVQFFNETGEIRTLYEGEIE